MRFQRYALYYVPVPEDDWARFATAWLGWDMTTGTPAPALPDPPPDIVTAAPRRYGVHATIKPPFALAPGTTLADLTSACAGLCAAARPLTLPGLTLHPLGRFLVLCPPEADAALSRLAAAAVRDLDRFRAPASQAEIARRTSPRHSPRQKENLRRWGYPHVLDDFLFHITLTGRLPAALRATTLSTLDRRLSPLLPTPFAISDLALAGEDDTGHFHLLHRFPLGG